MINKLRLKVDTRRTANKVKHMFYYKTYQLVRLSPPNLFDKCSRNAQQELMYFQEGQIDDTIPYKLS